MTIPDTRPADLSQPCSHPFVGCPCRQPGDATGPKGETVTTLIPGIDCSNYQPGDVSGLVAQYGAKHVVVRASTESDQHRKIAQQQLSTAQMAGCTLSVYIWAYWDLDPTQHVDNALRTVTGYPLTMVWVDCEDGDPGTRLDDWLSRAVAQIERRGHRAGIYTGTPWWRSHGDSHGFTRLPLWIANYNGQPTLDGIPLPGGWTSAAAHQWTSDPVDQNVFAEAVALPVPVPAPPPVVPPVLPPAPAQPYLVGDKTLAAIAAAGDVPATDEVYFHNGAGHAQWSDTIGRSGKTYRYVFSLDRVL